MDLNPAQRDLVLKVAELLVSKEECDRAEFWIEKAAKLLPGNPAVFNLKVRFPFVRISSETVCTPSVNCGSSNASLLTCF